ncbi:hypothetical protein [Wolbachia endosymbiont (group A) of Pipizella viduata]|uniref:hypothetical protein n=1 Tax=Wolbachia endosymbiont (group A) of Pipizella viduata TaxID=3066154 RepID=UPI00333F3565
MKTAVRAAGNGCNSYPEIFEFCFSQVSPDKYSDLLKRDLAENRYYGSLNTLQGALRFDQFQRLFDCLRPADIPKDKYCTLLRYIEIEKRCGSYLDSGVKLFMHMWVREGFDSHRASALNGTMMNNSVFQGRLLVPFVSKGCMEPVWAVLDKASPDQIKEFMGSRQADYIRSVLKERGDENSLNKFLSYGGSTIKELENPNASLSEVDLSEAHEAKRPKMR